MVKEALWGPLWKDSSAPALKEEMEAATVCRDEPPSSWLRLVILPRPPPPPVAVPGSWQGEGAKNRLRRQWRPPLIPTRAVPEKAAAWHKGPFVLPAAAWSGLAWLGLAAFWTGAPLSA